MAPSGEGATYDRVTTPTCSSLAAPRLTVTLRAIAALTVVTALFPLATAVLYSAAMWIGTPALLGRVEYWLPAAVLVATPLGLAAWRERRA